MKRRIVRKNVILVGILLIACLALLGGMMLQKNPLDTLKVGVVRGAESEEVFCERAEKMQDYLQAQYGEIIVTLHYYENDEALLEALVEENVQIAFVSGVGQALYGKDKKAVIAAENIIEYQGEYYPYHTSVLLKREYEGLDEFINREDPTTLQYCLLSSNSLTGYIFIQPYFETMGVSLKDMGNVTRIEDYAQGIEKLANGECEVSVGYLGILGDYADIWNELSGSERTIEEDLRVIYVSDYIYANAVSISKAVQQRKDLRECILDYLKENNYSESSYANYAVIKERIQNVLGGSK